MDFCIQNSLQQRLEVAGSSSGVCNIEDVGCVLYGRMSILRLDMYFCGGEREPTKQHPFSAESPR